MHRPLLIRLSGDTDRSCLSGVAEGADGAEWTLGSLTASEASVIPSEIRSRVRALALDCPSVLVEESSRAVIGALELAAMLQAPVLNIAIPSVGGAGGAGFDRYQDALNFTHSLLRATRLEAEAWGVAIAGVVPARGSLFSPVEVRELLDAAHSSTIGACVDVQAASRCGSIEDWLTTLGSRVRSIRVSQRDGFDVQGLRAGLTHVPDDRPLIVADRGQFDAYAGLCDVARTTSTE